MQDRVWRKCRHLWVWCPQKLWWMSPPFPNHQIAPPKSRKLGFPCSECCTRTRHIAGCTKYCSFANRILCSLRVAAYGKPLLAIPVRTLPEWTWLWEVPLPGNGVSKTLSIYSLELVLHWTRATFILFFASQRMSMANWYLHVEPVRWDFRQSFPSCLSFPSPGKVEKTNRKCQPVKLTGIKSTLSSLWSSFLDGLCWNIFKVGRVGDDVIVAGADLILLERFVHDN